jgi:O-antigen ligase
MVNYSKNKVNSFFSIYLPSTLTILIPFLLLTGSFLPDLAVTLCALFFLYYSLKYPKKYVNYYKNKFFIYLIIFWSIIIISSLFSQNILFSLETSFFYIRFILFFLSTWFLLKNYPRFITLFYYSLIFTISILILDSFLQFFTKQNIFGWPIIGTRLSSFFKDELILGSYISRLLPLLFALYVYHNEIRQNYLNKYIYSIIFILSEILIFLSGERAAFFYLNLSAFFVIIFSKNYKYLRLIILILSILSMILITFFDNNFKKRIVDYTIEQIAPSNAKEKKLLFFSIEHENHYKSAILMFKENMLFGVGPRMFRQLCNYPEFKTSRESCSTHPHNTYVQLLAETGILGFVQIFLLFLLLIYFSIKHLYLKIFKNIILFNDFQIALLSAILISLWPFTPTGNFFSNSLNVYYYLPLGFLFFSFNNSKIIKTKNKIK